MGAEILDQAFQLAMAIGQVSDVEIRSVFTQMDGDLWRYLLGREAVDPHPVLVLPVQESAPLNDRFICG